MIGLFNDCYPPVMDGVSVTVQNYARWLHRGGHDVCVATPAAQGEEFGEPFPVYGYFSLPIPMRKPYRMGFPQMDRAFQNAMARTDFSIVHTHSPFSAGKTALKIARQRGIPMVATFHSKYRADFERIIPNRQVVDYMIKGVVDFFEQADEVWIPQASVEETLREYGYRGHVEVVDNGNDFAADTRTGMLRAEGRVMLGVKDETPVLLFVGQHIWEKNPQVVLNALSRLRRRPWKMFFAGTGYAAADLKKLTAELGLTDRVTFLGQICDRERMKRLYAAADVFLFPSLYDNAPLVVREAAAMLTPSLMAAGSTAAAVVDDGVNGFLCEPDDYHFARRLSSILDDGALRARAGREARRTLARSWEDIAGEVAGRYANIIRRNRHKGCA